VDATAAPDEVDDADGDEDREEQAAGVAPDERRGEQAGDERRHDADADRGRDGHRVAAGQQQAAEAADDQAGHEQEMMNAIRVMALRRPRHGGRRKPAGQATRSASRALSSRGGPGE
jgi:hypothetical protein